MSNFENSIKKFLEEERSVEAKEILQDLSMLYEQFHCISRRMIYLLTGEEKSRTGLTDFIKSVFIRRRVLGQKEIMGEVTESFDSTTTSKAVSDSLGYLIETNYIEFFHDSETKKRKYRIPQRKRE
jgi:hypothetical protein